MRDLRRQATESKKTVSRKAQSRASGSLRSATKSCTESRDQSYHGSDSEGNFSKSRRLDLNSTDDEIINRFPVDINCTWTQEIENRIEEIKDRKRSSILGREKALDQYANLLMSHYAYEELHDKISDLVPAFMKCVKAESSEKEVYHALRAIALTIITIPSEAIFEIVIQGLKRSYRASKFHHVKAGAIHTLSTLATYGGASDLEIKEIMQEFLEIVESDGYSVDAGDSEEVVIAACEAWGYLATSLNDLKYSTNAAMEVFVEQLNSSNISVQIAAGENIALLFECSYSERETGDDLPINQDDDEGFAIDTSLIKRYEVYPQKDQLIYTLRNLSNECSKHISKKDRKNLHSSFSDILNTVEHPTRGPHFQNAIDMETGKRYGSRMKVHINKMGSMRIDKWWKLHRLKALKRVLGGGFLIHLQQNDVISDSVTPMIQEI